MKTIEKRFISNLNEVKEKIISEVSMYDILDYYNTDIINNKSLCIFHEEENPSLSIYDEGEAFKCFSCGASGNVISYIMEKEDVGFIEAIELLANRNNIEIIYKEMTEEEKITMENGIKITEMKKQLKDYYKNNLWNTEVGKKSVEYLTSRGFTIDILKEFDIGLSLDNDSEMKTINKISKELNISDKILEEEKISYKGYATLYDYIILPIIEGKKVIGFQGMLTKEERESIRTKEEEVFRPKYKTLSQLGIWNINALKNNSEINLLEGVTDALTMIQNGFENTIAVLGINQLDNKDFREELFEKTDKINVFFDNDKPGNEKARKLQEKMKSKINIVKVDLESNQDLSTIPEVLKKEYEKTITEMRKDINGIYNLCKLEGRDFKEEIKILTNNSEMYIDTLITDWNNEKQWNIKAEKFKYLLEEALYVYDNDVSILNGFKNMLNKEYKVKLGEFDSVLKSLKNEIIPIKENNEEVEKWVKMDGILYKKEFTGFGEDGELKFLEKEVTRTIPSIKYVLRNEFENTEEVMIIFEDRFGITKEIIVRRQDILTKASIINTLGMYGMNITDENANDIINYLQDFENTRIEEIKLKEITNKTGMYKDKYIGRRGEIITKDGLEKEEEATVVYNNLNENRNIRKIEEVITDEEYKEIIKNTLPSMLKLNETKVSLGIISWFLSSIFKEELQKMYKTQAFPPLNIYGVQGSGKTTIATQLQKLLGGTDEVMSANGTMFPLMQSMTLSNGFPLLIDEYKISDLGEYKNNNILNLMKVAYNSNVEMRGRADQSMNTYHLTTPLCLIGENAVTGDSVDAVKERTSIISVSKTWLEKNKKYTFDIYRELNETNMEGFYVKYIIDFMNRIETGEFKEIFDRAEKRSKEFYKEHSDLMTDRHLISITVLSVGTEILRELYKVADIEFEITEKDIIEMIEHSINHALDESEKESSLDRVMLYFSEILLKDFTLNELLLEEEERLFIKKTKLTTLLTQHSKRNLFEKIDKSSVNQYMIENEKAEGYIVETGKYKKIEGKTQLCIVIDLNKLERATGISPSTFLKYSNEIDLEEEIQF